MSAFGAGTWSQRGICMSKFEGFNPLAAETYDESLVESEGLQQPVQARPEADPCAAPQSALAEPGPSFAERLDRRIPLPLPRQESRAKDEMVGRLERLVGLIRLERRPLKEGERQPDCQRKHKRIAERSRTAEARHPPKQSLPGVV